MLEASVTARESGPVIVLSGETDLTSNAVLSALFGQATGRPLTSRDVNLVGYRWA
jgi:hypothetical protein